MTRAIPSFWADELVEMVRAVLTDSRLTVGDWNQLRLEVTSVAVSMKAEAVLANELSGYQAMLNAMGMLVEALEWNNIKFVAPKVSEHVEAALLRLASYNSHSPMDTFHEDLYAPGAHWKTIGTTVDSLSDISREDMRRMFTSPTLIDLLHGHHGWAFVGPHGNWLVESDSDRDSMRILAIVNPDSEWRVTPFIDWLVAKRKEELGG